MKRPSQDARGICLTPLPINIMLCCAIATVRYARISRSTYSSNFEVHVGNDRRGTLYKALWLGEAHVQSVCAHLVERLHDHK